MRGLKLRLVSLLALVIAVASFTDAWIETAVMSRLKDAGLSHLLQMRGLKHFRLNREHHRHSRIFYRCVD